tara:strand:+ start:35 stop:505 length:471 start_codon:yes stop_codon:yes gene_type:complete
MGVRTNDHQLVGGKQYFDSDVQVEGTIQSLTPEIITATDGQTLTADQSGATVVVGDSIAINLPTAAEGLNYKFVVNAAIGSDTSTVTAPVADTMFGVVDIAGTPTKKANVHILTFTANADEGDWAEIVCVSDSTTATDPVWHVYGVGAASTSINIV